MGVRSSQPRSPNLNKTDGHLLEYLRDDFCSKVEVLILET